VQLWTTVVYRTQFSNQNYRFVSLLELVTNVLTRLFNCRKLSKSDVAGSTTCFRILLSGVLFQWCNRVNIAVVCLCRCYREMLKIFIVSVVDENGLCLRYYFLLLLWCMLIVK